MLETVIVCEVQSPEINIFKKTNKMEIATNIKNISFDIST